VANSLFFVPLFDLFDFAPRGYQRMDLNLGQGEATRRSWIGL